MNIAETNFVLIGKNQHVDNVHIVLDDSEVAQLSDCFKANKLYLNIAETNFVLIGKNQHVDNVHIVLDDSEVAQWSQVKFLGITVDERLDWHADINHCKLKLTSSPCRWIIVLNPTVHRYEARRSGNVHAQYRHTQKVANSFLLNISPNCWHSLPTNLSSALSITTFNKWHKGYMPDHTMV